MKIIWYLFTSFLMATTTLAALPQFASATYENNWPSILPMILFLAGMANSLAFFLLALLDVSKHLKGKMFVDEKQNI